MFSFVRRRMYTSALPLIIVLLGVFLLARLTGDPTNLYLPESATLRRFGDRIYWLFDTPKDVPQAGCRLAAILRDPAFLGVPELVKAMGQLDEEKSPKLMASLNNPWSRRVRTNNHVERTNRMIRLWEKVRYKWRRRRTLVRFVVLKLDDIGGHWSPPQAQAKSTLQPKEVKQRQLQRDDGRQPRRVA